MPSEFMRPSSRPAGTVLRGTRKIHPPAGMPVSRLRALAKGAWQLLAAATGPDSPLPSRACSASDRDEFPMFAPDDAKPVADLPNRRVGLDGLDHGREQVFLSAGARFEPVHRGLPRCRVAFGPNSADTLALPTLAFRVDLLQ